MVRSLQSGDWVGRGLQPSDPDIRMRGGFRNCSLSVGQKVNPFCMTPSCPTPHYDLFTLTRKGDNLAKLKFTDFYKESRLNSKVLRDALRQESAVLL